MTNLRNAVQLIGHLGKDPEIKKLENGIMLATVSIATNESYKDAKGEYVKQTSWHRLVGWEKVAARMEKQMTKGKEVAIQGKLVQRSYEDKNGIKRYVTEVRIFDFLMMEKEARKTDKTEQAEVEEVVQAF